MAETKPAKMAQSAPQPNQKAEDFKIAQRAKWSDGSLANGENFTQLINAIGDTIVAVANEIAASHIETFRVRAGITAPMGARPLTRWTYFPQQEAIVLYEETGKAIPRAMLLNGQSTSGFNTQPILDVLKKFYPDLTTVNTRVLTDVDYAVYNKLKGMGSRVNVDTFNNLTYGSVRQLDTYGTAFILYLPDGSEIVADAYWEANSLTLRQERK